jgi:hypothetical protein
MSALNWIGTGAGLLGKITDDKAAAALKKFSRYFQGTFGVTIGNAIAGNFGTTLQSYYGPYITHCVDTKWMGAAGFLGNFLNASNAFESSLVSGVGGYVTWVYGPNITVNYGGPAGTVYRCKKFEKTASYLGPWGDAEDPLDYIPHPKGEKPKGPEAEVISDADKAMAKVVTALSVVLNLMVAILEVAAKFTYTNYDSSPNLPDPSDNNYPLGGINLALGFVPPRLMGLIYAIERAGSLETFGSAWVKCAKDFLIDVVTLMGAAKDEKAKLQSASWSAEDAIAMILAAITVLAAILGLAAGVAAGIADAAAG